jgi:hypothetical protein
MTDNLSSKCFAMTTDNCTGEAFGELFLAMTDNLYPIHLENLSFAVEKTIGFNLDGVYLANASPLLTTNLM